MAVSVVGLSKIPKIMVGVLVIVFVVNAMGVGAASPDINSVFGTDSDVLVEEETSYSSLSVTEKNNFRTLYIDGAVQSQMDLNDPSKLVLYYTKIISSD